MRVADGKVLWRLRIGKYSPGIVTERHYFFTLNGIVMAWHGRRSPQILEKLRAKLPNTKVLILAIFPRGASKDHGMRKVNEGANDIVKNLADNKMVYFLDIGPKFLGSDGTLSKDVMPDLLHLNEGSYRTWAEAIEPKVKELMGEK